MPLALALAAAGCVYDPPSAPPTPTAPAATAAASEADPTAAPTAAPSESAQGAQPPPLGDVSIALEPVVQLDQPIAMAVRDGDDALYFAEREGRVRAVVDGEVRNRPVLDITGNVSSGGERGLLGLTFSPDGESLIVSYTNTEGDSRVDSYPMRNGRAVADERRELLAVDQPYGNHNGGNVVIGPDDMLYVGLGDGGAGGDPEGNAQNPGTLLGKLLRLNPEDGAAAGGNPFEDDGDYRPEIFATGLRNPWRFSFDRETQDLWVGDVGQSEVEEISVVRAQRAAGRNFGWDIFEGSRPYEGGGEPARYAPPVVEYPTGAQGCAVTGGYVYRGDAIPELQGAYLYSDFCGGWLRAVRVRGGEVVDEAELASDQRVASFGEDAAGELYVLSLEGTVSRIVGG